MSDDDKVKTLQRIDTNVKWMKWIGGGLFAILLSLGGWLYGQDYEQFGLISTTVEAVENVEHRVDKVEKIIEYVQENK